MAEVHIQRRLVAILAADVAGYSRLMGADEEGTLAALTTHIAELIEPCVSKFGGRIVKTTGDGILAEFVGVVDAVRCAVAWQQGMQARNASVSPDRRIRFRIGINLGDVIARNEDIYGDGVNVAARMEGLAEPDGICVSGTVFDHLHGKADVRFTDLGEQRVKNIARPVRAYRVVSASDGRAKPVRKMWKSRAVRICAAVGLAAVSVSILAWSESWTVGSLIASGEPALRVPTDKASIAVLPFANESADKSQEYFADGISEDIIVELSKNSGLHVIARNSSYSYKGTALDVGSISRALGVRYLLSGTVRREHGRIRISAELIDGRSGANVWADRFDRRVEEVFSVQDEITERIIVTLVAEVMRSERQRVHRKPPASLDAYDNYLRGLERFRARATRPPWGRTLSESREFLERAIRLDPGFGLAWSVLAENYVSAWIQRPHFEPLRHEHQNPQTLARALESARKAIEADSRLAEGYAKMGWVLHWMRRPEEAQSAYRRAFEINPNLLDDAYPNALVKFGRHREAIAYLERQVRLDPAFGRNYGNLGLAYYFERSYEKAISSLRTCKRLAPGWRACNIWMAAALARIGRAGDAKAEVRLVTERDPSFSVAKYVAFEPYSRREDAMQLSAGLLKAGFRN